MAKTLNMVFTRGDGTKTISLVNPKDNLTGGEVFAVMRNIVSKNVFHYETGEQIDGVKSASIRETVITELVDE